MSRLIDESRNRLLQLLSVGRGYWHGGRLCMGWSLQNRGTGFSRIVVIASAIAAATARQLVANATVDRGASVKIRFRAVEQTATLAAMISMI